MNWIIGENGSYKLASIYSTLQSSTKTTFWAESHTWLFNVMIGDTFSSIVLVGWKLRINIKLNQNIVYVISPLFSVPLTTLVQLKTFVNVLIFPRKVFRGLFVNMGACRNQNGYDSKQSTHMAGYGTGYFFSKYSGVFWTSNKHFQSLKAFCILSSEDHC